MTKVLVTESYFEDIADSIRNKNGTGNVYKPSEMSAAIDALVVANLGTKSITANGTYNASDDSVNGYSQVTVNVPSDTLVSKTITANGTYDPADDSADGYSSVTVNVPSSGGNVSVPIISYGSDVKFNGIEVGPFSSKSTYIVPTDNSYSALVPDWSSPFEIKITFTITATSSDYQAILCSKSGYWQQPDIQIGQNLSSIWTEFTSDGSAGTTISFSVADDGISLPLDTECWAKIVWDGTNYSFTYYDGTNTHTKSITPGTTPYVASSATMKMGSGPWDRPFKGRINLQKSYIKINGTAIWGNVS